MMGMKKMRVVVEVLMIMGLMMMMCMAPKVGAINPGKPRYLNYGAVNWDKGPSCGPHTPKPCFEQPINRYERGCLAQERCRDGSD